MSSTVVGTSIDDADDTLSGFQYFGNWGLGESIPEHYSNTAHYSNSSGSQAILFFRGTSIIYYADRQAALSLATVSVDGLPPDRVNLTSATPQYRQAVWSKNVTDGDHQLVIQHAGGPGTDIMVDYVTILSNGSPISNEAGLAASTVSYSAQFMDDTSEQVQYSPNNWRFVTEGLFFNKSSQITQSRGASFQVTFNGTAIWYFTDTGPDHGNVRIRVDNEGGEDDDDSEVASGYSPRPLAQRLVWSKTDLDAGTHTVNITHDDVDGKYATLDFFRYTPSDGTQPSGKKSTSTGVIVGATIAGLFFLGILYCVFLCWASPRFRRRSEADENAPPPSYRAANRPSSQSSDSTSPYYPYVDAPTARPDVEPLGGRIPMSSVMPSTQVGRYPMTMRRESVISVGEGAGEAGPTPAQVYRDSIRASMIEGRNSVSNSGAETSSQMTQTGPDASLAPITETEETGGRSGPPSYQHH